MKYSISNTQLKNLWLAKQEERLSKEIRKFSGAVSLEEMATQMESDNGPFAESIKRSTTKFSNRTENVEILTADHLSSLYFPNIETDICFEMKDSFHGGIVTTYNELTENISQHTHIDCSISSGLRSFNFQIKRYPEPYKKITNEAVSSFIEETIKRYSDMKGTILIILLQAETPIPREGLDFDKIHKYVSSMKRTGFDEINFIFNKGNRHIHWRQVYPDHGYSEIPLILLSDKYKKV